MSTTDELCAQGYHFNVKIVAASLRRQGLRAKTSRKFKPVSYRAHNLHVSENLLEQDFYASGPNQKWAGDIAYLRTAVSGSGHVPLLAGQCATSLRCPAVIVHTDRGS